MVGARRVLLNYPKAIRSSVARAGYLYRLPFSLPTIITNINTDLLASIDLREFKFRIQSYNLSCRAALAAPTVLYRY